MVTQLILLRGINVGAANRIAMPVLRESLTAAGFVNVRTHLQSGNILADGDPDALVAAVKAVIDVPCVTRSIAELAAVIAANPFPTQAAENPKLLQVTFRSEPAGSDVLEALTAKLSGGEKVAVHGREVYSWHPDGIARSKLALAVAPPKRAATARNWNTVLTLKEMADA